MKKIYIDKSDSASAVAEKIIGSGEDSVVLYIPRFTKLSASINNFRILKRESEAAGKKIEIESVDDDVLEMSKSIGIKAGNPFFMKNKRSVSDIVLPGSGSLEHAPHAHHNTHHHGAPGHPVHSHHKAHNELAENEPARPAHHRAKGRFSLPRLRLPNFGGNLKGKFFTAAVIAAVIGAIALAAIVLPSAKIVVTMDKVNWNFTGNLFISAAATADKQNVFTDNLAKIHGDLIEKTLNMTKPYPATGEENVANKATGKITIYNAYSSDPQPIVNSTRFSSPEGKIFRITKGVTIPGAKIVDNKVVPSSIEVDVVANAAGAEYNIAPTTFKIPGFQGSPKYAGFYGESTSAMAGGFVGRMKVATAADIAAAKTAMTKSLESALKSEILLVPSDIKIIDGSLKFIVSKIDVQKGADESGNFKVTGVGVIRTIGFKESNLFDALKAKLIVDYRTKNNLDGGESIDLVLKENKPVVYSNPVVDLSKRELITSIKMESTWARVLDVGKFKAEVAGKRQKDLAAGALPSPGISSMSVSLWPFWVMTIPKNQAKITVDVQ